MKQPVVSDISEPGEQRARPPDRMALDSRHPLLLDHRGQVLEVTDGYVDIFAISLGKGAAGVRHHLLRLEVGDIILDLQDAVDSSGRPVRLFAVGGPGASACSINRSEFTSQEGVATWIRKLAGLISDRQPNWQASDLPSEGVAALPAGDRFRGSMHDIVWVSLQSGSARILGMDPPFDTGGPPMPLTSGLWIEADDLGCIAASSHLMPDASVLWLALDQFHQSVLAWIDHDLFRGAREDRQRLINRSELAASLTLEAFERLSAIVLPADREQIEADQSDPLIGACQIIGHAMGTPLVLAGRPTAGKEGFAAVVEIARSLRWPVRQTALRDEWWKRDAGPLLAWRGADRSPVALIPDRSRRYVMIDAATGVRRRVDRRTAADLAPDAVTFYPSLPPGPIRFRDLLLFSFRHSRGNISRIILAVLAIGLLSLVAPLLTNVLVSSIIPRTELDQLTFFALGLSIVAIATASIQLMEGFAILRLEALVDWRLQAAMVDRLLRLPASLFRAFTVGDLVDRVMGVEAARRILTGSTLRGLIGGLFAWFSIALMFYYDRKLALVAIALTLLRALSIFAANLVRLYHETRNYDVQGKLGGFVLQLLAGIGKLRVAAATDRALAIWSRQFSVQRRHALASQRAANALTVFETTFPTVATLIIFAVASSAGSALLADVGAFLGFFAAFGQSLGSIGAWASGVSEALIVIPHVGRLRPLMASAIEISEDRKPPGELLGAIELSRVTFRYLQGGPPVLDNVSLKVAPGEYLAIVGPSGSGKSSIFRLLLGFERSEMGTVFFDGKAIDTLDVSAVRRQLGVVLQNAKLATGSIYENICGGVQLPLELAWRAARLAGVDADIRTMPMGMHTMIAEGVNTLSGGQRQRIMIARAVARRPRILLFDEATSSLDNQSQAIVSEALGDLNVTRIVIAHRLSTVRRADRIVMLVDGKIVQSGTFEELTKRPGLFASFAQRQLV
jgi:NHLM bacteriocin system ABC transporter ATP-binding protein